MQYNPDGAMLGYVHSFCDGIRANYQVDPRHYVTDTIKRGLRNADGTGVLVGATGIGSVQGYMMLDGEPIPMPGRLYYRGIDLREIVGAHIDEEIFGFEEVSYLLLLGKLPTRAELAAWGEALSITRELPDGFDRDILLAAPSSSVMNMLSRAVEALYAYDSAPDDTSLENMVRQSIELISRVPVIVAHAFSIKRNTFDGEPLKLYTPQTDKSLAENFLHMLRSGDHYSPEEARLLDLLLTIHAEHGGGTSSAFACRLLASAGSDVYGAVASAINVVKGPMDGGACLLVKRMFEDICENVPDMDDEAALSDYLNLILDGEAGDGSGRIYGLGHAVYTQSDPRALLLKQAASDLAEKTGFSEKFRRMEAVERVGVRVITDRQTLRKPICANVDMISGLVFEMLGIPEDLFEPLFCVAHIASWCAHRIEEMLSGNRMMRPAYRAVAARSDYVSIDHRG